MLGKEKRITNNLTRMNSFDPQQLETVCATLDRWCAQDKIPGAGLAVGSSDGVALLRTFGRHHAWGDTEPMPDDAIFLVASITKPIVCTALMILVERGEVTLTDTVAHFVPEFEQLGKRDIQVRHLLTHTSGLPDMLPENARLRTDHEPMPTFVARTCASPLAFCPGYQVKYQSMGITMISEIILRITGMECPEFLRAEMFSRLGMDDSMLGVPAEWRAGDGIKTDRIAGIRITPEEAATDWHWNSDYWRSFGAPWGGLLTTPADLARCCRMMLNGGELDGTRIISPTTVGAMSSNQLTHLPHVPEVERRCQPWGLGWRLNHRDGDPLNDLLPMKVYGHWGATGTLLWIDPDQDSFFVLLTTEPMLPNGVPYIVRISNMVAAAIR